MNQNPVTSDGEEGHHLGDTEPYDAVILDLGLPKLDGVTVLQKWRKAGRTMPVARYGGFVMILDPLR